MVVKMKKRIRIYWNNGIVFGWSHCPASIIIHIGFMLIDIPVKIRDIVKMVNNGTWPKNRLWIVRYAKFKGD